MPQATSEQPLPRPGLPRDCGHDCTVCRVTLVSLTDYAGHISSPQHKQNVEASESAVGAGGPEQDVDYFDQALVDLIEKRKELLRKEEAAAEARRAREESERRRQQDFQERLREAKERFRLNLRGRQPPLLGYGAPRTPEAWNSGAHPACRGGDDPRAADHPAWAHGRQGKSATWHAQDPPPSCHGCGATGEWGGGSLGSSQGYRAPPLLGCAPGSPRGRHPWLSNRGSSHGLYGRNNIPQYPQQGRAVDLGPPPCRFAKPSPPGPFSPRQVCSPERRHGDGPGDCHRGNGAAGPKSHGANPKADKACRWSPYPPTKSFEKDEPPPGGPRGYPDAAVPCQHETAGGGGGVFARPAPVERDARHRQSDADAPGRKKKPTKNNNNNNNKNRNRSSSGSRSSSSSSAAAAAAGVKRDKPRDTPPGDTAQDMQLETQGDAQRETKRDRPRDRPRAKQRDAAEVATRDKQGDAPRVTPRATPRATQRDTQRDTPQATQRAAQRDTQRDTPQTTPQVTPQATQRDSQADRQGDRQADRQRDRQGEPDLGLSQSARSPGKSKSPTGGRKPDQRDRKSSLTPSDKPRPGRTPARDKKPKTASSSSSSSSRSLPAGPLQSRQEQQISELPNKSKEAALERRGSAGGGPSERRKETPPPAPSSVEQEAQQRVSPESPEGANKENNCSPSGAEGPSPDPGRPSHPDRSEYLQSVHVSTSSTPGVPSTGEEQEKGGRREQGGGGSCVEGAVAMEVEEQQQEQEEEEEEEEEVSRSHQGTGSEAWDPEATAGEMSQSEESEAAVLNAPPPAAAAAPPTAAPGPTRLGLTGPVLTKHASSKGKAGSHEPSLHKPNLHIARRVRNVSESRRGDAEKESGLKPTVRQLISSSGSRRNVNWEQVYQEVRKKQGQGKGWPRFGIEMVSYDREEPPQEEDPDMALLEGFQWDSLLDSAHSVAPRKRSLSESSVAPGRPAPSLDLFSCHVPGDRAEEEEEEVGGGPPPQTRPFAPEEQEEEEHKVFSARGADGAPVVGAPAKAGARKPSEGVKKGRVRVLQRAQSEVEVCGLGAELLDAQAMGKKRRAAGDIPSQEIHSLKKNKRMKIKSKKERFQVDQLLAVSLKEEELSLSLQALDTGLIQARATLQAAYMEVQRIMVQKQQVATEMGNLRNQRIELLKGMKGGFEDPAAPPQVKQEHGEFDSSVAPPPPPSTATAAATDVSVPGVHLFPPVRLAPPPPASSSPPARPGTPPAPTVVKQEPLSPDRESKQILVTLVRSCTPEIPATLTNPLPDPVKLQWSPDRGPVADQTHSPPSRGLGSAAHCKDDLPVLDQAVQVDRETSQPDSKLHLAPLTAPRRTSDPGNHGNASVKSEESGPTPPLSPPLPATLLPPSSPEMVVKRVRKLRKRRVLNKTQGAEPAGATSDTEADEAAAAAKPRRPPPPRRRSSAGSTVSTSTPPTAPEDEERGALEEEQEERAAPSREEEFDSALEMGESCADAVNLESSEPEECMEVTMACQQRPPPAPGPRPGPGLGLGLGPAQDSSRAEFFNLACNEVTSTSDMDTSPAVRPYPSAGQMPLPPTKDIKVKTSSDLSSDPGEEEAPTEGVFEGHQEAVNGLQIHKGLLYTCSGDRTVKAFDLVSHECVAVFEGHTSKVNCVLVSAVVGLTHRLFSGSSDLTIRCYSLRTRVLELQFYLPDRVLCLHSRWKVLYAGLANGTVATFNLKTNRPMDVFECHGPRAVSCLSSAQEGARKVLLVGSYDSTVSVRDARNGLLLRTLEGHTKTVLCMKVVNDLVFSGSSDHSVHAHNIHTGELVRIYKGHSHAVTVVAILGKVMLTASLDKLVRVYELQSHDRLQVYGGHKDMVMCMTVHKSMIYTGCYDGSVQAVKLNLLQNYRCMWHGCSLVFGVREHLEQHLADAHANPCFQTLKCRWRSCDEFFCARNGSKQGIAAHMQKHVEELVRSDT